MLDWCAVILRLGVVFAFSKCTPCCGVVVVIGSVVVILGVVDVDVDVDVVVVDLAAVARS